MSPRAVAGNVVVAVTLTVLSTAVPGTITAVYPDITGCEAGCEVAAAGFPIPFVADYPAVSPAASATAAGALLGVDQVHWLRAIATFAAWVAFAFAVRLAATGLRQRKRA